MLYVDERPQTFDEVKEQEFIIKNLQSQAKRGVFFNSIILCGKYGTGKTTVARIIAREELREQGRKRKPLHGMCKLQEHT